MIIKQNNQIRTETVELKGTLSYLKFTWENEELVKIYIRLSHLGSYHEVDITKYNSVPGDIYKLLEHYFEEKFKEMQKPNIQQV